MSDLNELSAGDVLVFQIESGFGLMRILGIEQRDNDTVWHIAAYGDYFLTIEMAESSLSRFETFRPQIEHIALTNRAFFSTQTARLGNFAVTDRERDLIASWQKNPVVSDRSVRLLLGIR